jgi:hypothetical protein
MSNRNFSMEFYWAKTIEKWEPLLSFKGTTKEHWEEWKKEALPQFEKLLGRLPNPVPLDAEVVYSLEENGLIRERVIFNTEEHMSIPCQVLRPKHMLSNKTNPAILCCHGHSLYAKDTVSGIKATSDYVREIESMNFNYAEQMARAGFLTIAPDLRLFGERKDKVEAGKNTPACNINFIKGAIIGVYMLTLDVWDMKCCIDYLETRPEINPSRIGMMGLSLGGTITTFTSAFDERIKATDIIAYINPWAGFGIRQGNFCGSQVIPEVFKYFDTHDIAGLIAPRPLLVEMGVYDSCFPIHDLLEGYEGLKKIYKAAGVEDKLYEDIHPGGHAFAAGKAFNFFEKYL